MLSLYPLTDKKEDRPIFETSRSRIQIGVHLKAIGLIVVFDNLFRFIPITILSVH
ncbi:hypothetical protein [Prevotella bivia]|uniref:hypothetical protein n=1 Tax=Prevotella bivia TaxID=28125 RepID=UPI0007E0B853|nr:hypothetical protein [Prevotella bivia]KXU57087.1 hypothetical protein HMPREF3218_0201631 [Prevotella bivia]MDU2329287.1 hypothetical protein [Prevotella bivia]